VLYDAFLTYVSMVCALGGGLNFSG
jgi:hypothetical protein